MRGVAKMDFTKQLSACKTRTDERLEIFFNEEISKAKKVNPSVAEVTENLRNFVLRGGKRLRAALLITTYELFGGTKQESIIDFACSMELTHSALLVHDDIIDDDDLRRGEKTVHRLYADRLGKSIEISNYFGKSSALLAGDILSHLSIGLFLQMDFTTKEKIEIITYLQDRMFETGIGQFLDINFSDGPNLPATPTEIILTLKTTGYTTLSPIYCGALLAGAGDHVYSTLDKYAHLIGQAFQVQDDILGFFGKQETIGKPVGSDFREGKLTPITKLLLAKVKKEEKKFIKSLFGQDKISVDDFTKVQKIAANLKIDTEVSDKAKKLIQQAQITIKTSRLPEKVKDFFSQTAEYIIERSS